MLFLFSNVKYSINAFLCKDLNQGTMEDLDRGTNSLTVLLAELLTQFLVSLCQTLKDGNGSLADRLSDSYSFTHVIVQVSK